MLLSLSFGGVAVLPAGAAQAASPSAAAKEEPSAEQILQRAIDAQGLPKAASTDEALPLALHVKANLNFKTAKGDVFNINAERKFLGQKDGLGLIWTRAVSTSDKKVTETGFDGKKPWLWTTDASGKGVIRWLDEPGTEEDRRQLERDLETTAQLTRAFLLKNLVVELKDLKRLGEESRDGAKCWILGGTTEVERDQMRKPVLLRLWIDQANARFLGARVEVVGEPPLRFHFQKHERDERGFDCPHKVMLYVGDEKEPSQTLYLETLSLGVKLTPEEFAPPKQ